MSISSINLPYAKQSHATTKSFSPKTNDVPSDPSKKSHIPSFGDLLGQTLEAHKTGWDATEQAVAQVALGNVDSETVIPMVAQTNKEVMAISAIVESSKAALTKILDMNV